MNYDNKQRLLLQMEEVILCLHTEKTLGVDYFWSWNVFNQNKTLYYTTIYHMN